MINYDRVFPNRRAMLLSITGTIISFTLFGFSVNFVWALCARVLLGLLDGIMGISKTYISEVCYQCCSYVMLCYCLLLMTYFITRYVTTPIKLKVLHQWLP